MPIDEKTLKYLKSLSKTKLVITLESALFKKSLFEFFKEAARTLEPSTKWDFNFHFQYTCNILQQEFERIERGDPKEKDIIINLPFRSGKSLLVSVVFPAWCLMKNPTASILNISATQELATNFSHKALMLINSQWFQDRFPHVQLRVDSKAKSHFITTAGGSIQAFGVNSVIIGSGASHFIILDDPNSPNETSQIAHTSVINTYLDIIYSRLNNPSVGSRIICQQRINIRDLTGYLLSTQPDNYLNICMPAVLSEDLNPTELAEYYTDGLFWSTRFTQKVLDDFKKTLRGSAYASQLMMRPALLEGEVLKRAWFKIVKQSEVVKLPIKWIMTIDTAYTKETRNDPSSIMISGRYGNNMYIRKVYQRWLEFNKLIELIKEVHNIYDTRKILIEGKASGLSIVQELKRQTNYNITIVNPNGKDKLSRVTAAAPLLESGRILLVEDDWNESFLNECSVYPAGRDDQVDVLVYSVKELLQMGGGTIFR